MKRSDYFYLCTFLIFISSCSQTVTNSDENNNDPEEIPEEVISTKNEQLFSFMTENYLWNEYLFSIENSDTIPIANYFDSLLYKQLDRWSRLVKYNSYSNYYDNGTYVGYGFSYDFDMNNDLRFRYVYKDGPFGKLGIKRGWKVLNINGQSVESISDWDNILGEDNIGTPNGFIFEDLDGNIHKHLILKDLVTINTVLHFDTLSVNDENIGYLAFKNFLETSKIELDSSFQFFEKNNISKLILDLRYNGGGRISVASHLANHIAGSNSNGKIFAKLSHNENRKDWDKSYSINFLNNLNLSELIVLTTNSTASASELIINGLNPLMKLTIIGTENTKGKNVGSYTWKANLDDDFDAITLISFYSQNQNNDSNYSNGFTPHFYTCDDLTRSFGDPKEGMLKSTIEYLKYGSVTDCTSHSSKNLFPGLEIPFEEPEHEFFMLEENSETRHSSFKE